MQATRLYQVVISAIASRVLEPEKERSRALTDRVHIADGHVVDPERDVRDGGRLDLIKTRKVHIGAESEKVVVGSPAGHQRERRVEDREHCRELNFDR